LPADEGLVREGGFPPLGESTGEGSDRFGKILVNSELLCNRLNARDLLGAFLSPQRGIARGRAARLKSS
jgi:hypothetical protein